MSSKYVVEEVNLDEHRAEVVSLWVSNLSGGMRTVADAEAKLSAGYLDNPAGAGRGLLIWPEGEHAAAGVIGLHPRTFHSGTESIRAANLADYAVSAAHRTLGPALMLMRQGLALARQHFDLVYTLPNRTAEAVCARAGLKRIGHFSRCARPLSSRRFLRMHTPRAAALLAPLADAALGLVDALRSLTLRPGLRLHDVGFDAPVLEQLWAHRDPGLLLSDRSRAMLQWRYGAPARGAWQVSVAQDRAGMAVAYLIWRLRDGMAEAGDFLSIDARRWTAPLMDAFARHARRRGADSASVKFFGSPAIVADLRRAGYHQREPGEPVLVVAASVEGAGEAGRWYLTAFDNDAD